MSVRPVVPERTRTVSTMPDQNRHPLKDKRGGAGNSRPPASVYADIAEVSGGDHPRGISLGGIRRCVAVAEGLTDDELKAVCVQGVAFGRIKKRPGGRHRAT